jgi:UV damage endonuclease UvdE
MLGFACKINSAYDTPDASLNIKGTTLTWLRNATHQAATKKLEQLLEHNLTALAKQIEFVGALPKQQRMFRITSDLLPAYTTEDFLPFYYSLTVQDTLEQQLLKIGTRARSLGIRLSMHPGQFCVLASDNPAVVENSIAEFEYHADIIRWMGYGKYFQDFKCNIHIGGKRGPQGLRKAYSQLSKVARNTITVENQEFTWGLEHCLELADIIPVVFDIHHDSIYTGLDARQYRSVTDNQIAKVLISWRGLRPTMHVSCSRVREADHDIIASKQALRAHSDYIYDESLLARLYEYHEHFDIMVEAKEKNFAQQAVADNWVQNFGFDVNS